MPHRVTIAQNIFFQKTANWLLFVGKKRHKRVWEDVLFSQELQNLLQTTVNGDWLLFSPFFCFRNFTWDLFCCYNGGYFLHRQHERLRSLFFRNTMVCALHLTHDVDLLDFRTTWFVMHVRVLVLFKCQWNPSEK